MDKDDWNAGHVGENGNAPPYAVSQSAVAASCDASTDENVLATITIPAGMLGANGLIRIGAAWSWTASANNKTFRYRLGGLGGTVLRAPTFTTTTGIADVCIFANVNSQSSQKGLLPQGVQSPYGNSSSGFATAAIDTSVATTIVITGQKASAGETLTLEGYICELFNGV